MQRLISVMCGLILATGLVLAGAGPAAAQATLQGSWTATKAERDGKAADGRRRAPAHLHGRPL